MWCSAGLDAYGDPFAAADPRLAIARPMGRLNPMYSSQERPMVRFEFGIVRLSALCLREIDVLSGSEYSALTSL